MQYKITYKNHFRALEFILIVSAALLAFLFYEYKYDRENHPGIEYDVFLFWMLTVLPTLYLHVEYYLFNRQILLEIDTWEKQITYWKNTSRIGTYSFNDVLKITIYMPPSWYRNSSFKLLPFEQYHYARITFADNKELVITSLLIPKVLEGIKEIKGIPLEKEKRIFASILLS